MITITSAFIVSDSEMYSIDESSFVENPSRMFIVWDSSIAGTLFIHFESNIENITVKGVVIYVNGLKYLRNMFKKDIMYVTGYTITVKLKIIKGAENEGVYSCGMVH